MSRLFVFAIAAVACYDASAASLLDTWQLQTQTTASVNVNEDPQPDASSATPASGIEFLSFNRDKTVTGSEWIISDYLSGLPTIRYDANKSPTSLSRFIEPLLPNKKPYATFTANGSNYTVKYDIGRLNARNGSDTLKMTDAWLARSGHLDLLAQANSLDVAKITAVTGRIAQYTHQGHVVRSNGGPTLNGTVTVKYALSYKADGTAKTADLVISNTYTGSRFPVKSRCCGLNATANAAQGQAFLEAIGNLPNVTTTSSGLKYLKLQEGTGTDTAKTTSTATVNYRGFFPSGVTFDSGVLKMATVGSGWIDGWIEGLQLMKANSKYRFFVPANLAYGDEGKGNIGPKAPLVFDIEIINLTTPAQ